MEQDALNATLAGGFAPLSPRFNFMGDFFLLDLERQLEPIVLHFVNAPKPWELAHGGAKRVSPKTIATGSRPLPWPDWAKAPETPPWRRARPPLTALRQAFAARLLAFLDETPFLDR